MTPFAPSPREGRGAGQSPAIVRCHRRDPRAARGHHRRHVDRVRVRCAPKSAANETGFWCSRGLRSASRGRGASELGGLVSTVLADDMTVLGYFGLLPMLAFAGRWTDWVFGCWEAGRPGVMMWAVVVRLLVRWTAAVVGTAAVFVLAWWLCAGVAGLDEGAAWAVAGVAAAVVLALGAWWAPRESNDGRAAALERRGEALDDLKAAGSVDPDDPVGLLYAGRSPAPFRGRRRELRQLADWCTGDSSCPVLILGGPAGVGKSRLALEFASGFPENWVAGWLHAGAGGTVVSAVRACLDPALILVDDADGRADLIPLLNALAEHHNSPAIRVILLTRSAAGLAAALASQLPDHHDQIVTGARALELEPHGAPEDQERWFGQAVAAFAAALGVPAPKLPVPSAAAVAGPGETMLELQAGALLAVLGGAAAAGDPRRLSPGQVAAGLMTHEKRRWHVTAATWQWSSGSTPRGSVQERAVATLVLLGSASVSEAEQILRKIPELRDATAERLAALASWVLALYPPGPGGTPRMRPDMISEWFVVSQLTAHLDLAQRLREGLTDEQAARALAFLARAADRIDAAVTLFSGFASGGLQRRVMAAAQAALTGETGQHLVDAVIAELIQSAQGWSVSKLIEIDGLIPEHVLPLTRIAIADVAVQFYRDLDVDSLAGHQAGLAAWLGDLGNRLAKTGRFQEALPPAEESVALRRDLYRDNPAAHQPALAIALGNFSITLAELGRFQEALPAAEESVALRWDLYRDNPAAHQPGLAIALDNVAGRLVGVGRYQEGLVAAEESVALRRVLYRDSPAAHRADLALALNNLGVLLAKLGRYQEALPAAEEAVALYRLLYRDSPAAHRADLALALSNFGKWGAGVGRYQEALAAAEEAVALYRVLYRDNPPAYRPNLAMALNSVGALLAEFGRYQEALAAAEEAVALHRVLYRDSQTAHGSEFAMTLGNCGNWLAGVGRYQEALATAEESVAVSRVVSRDNPAAHHVELAAALSNAGIRLAQVGRYQEALLAAEESVGLCRVLARDNPAVHRSDLALALGNLGIRFDQVHQYKTALAVKTESVGMYRELALSDPDLYQDRYRQRLSALRREYDQHGIQYPALLQGLTDPPNHPLSPPPSVA